MDTTYLRNKAEGGRGWLDYSVARNVKNNEKRTMSKQTVNSLKRLLTLMPDEKDAVMEREKGSEKRGNYRGAV